MSVETVKGLLGRWIILDQLLQNVLIFNIEYFILESEKKFRLLIQRDFILQEFQQRCIVISEAH